MADALTTLRDDVGTAGLWVHQALHGYAEGHRLLESSIAIPDDLKRLMLRMSDLSGTSVVNGFRDYLTGYPLRPLNAYALAKTWYASEMSRPGCVWTHTFIIPASAMARITSLSAVQRAFKRPNGGSTAEGYSKPVLLEPESLSEYELVTPDRIAMQALIAAHYQNNFQPLVIPAGSSDEHAAMILALWSQKWPTLRMSFTFCTGSLSARTFENRPLEIQCVPIGATRQVCREILEAGAAEPIVLNPTPIETEPWVVVAADDALRLEVGPVRCFLWSVADEDSGRTELQSFVKIYKSLRESREVLNVLGLTVELFPHSKDGRRLKKLIFGSAENTWIPHLELREVLLALATTAHYESLDPDQLSLSEQGSRLFKEYPKVGCLLLAELFRASLNPIGDEILKSLILAMRPEHALTFAADRQQFLPALFRVNPALATSANLWRLAKDRNRELFESLAEATIEPQVVRGIIDALLESNSDSFIGLAFERWGSIAVLEALDWIEGHGTPITKPHRAALRLRVYDVMTWIKMGTEKSTSILAALAHVVAPCSRRIAENDSTVWLRTLHRLRDGHQDDEANYISAFLLALALCNAPPAPLDLVSNSFERIHRLAARDQLRDEAWFILQPLVPELIWFKNWDKCERMRRALVSAFVRHAWPARQLKQCIRNRELVEELLETARRIGAEDYFWHV
jgi:hypothetical protein